VLKNLLFSVVEGSYPICQEGGEEKGGWGWEIDGQFSAFDDGETDGVNAGYSEVVAEKRGGEGRTLFGGREKSKEEKR